MELREFLYEAKKKTYASGMEKKTLEDGCKELTYEAGIYRYRDRYYGTDPFSGQEIVFQKGTDKQSKDSAIWAMSYQGRIMSPNVSAEKIYSFLRKALQNPRIAFPYRGPKKFEEGGLTYRNNSFGVLEQFNGEETIMDQDEMLYSLVYFGGNISNK